MNERTGADGEDRERVQADYSSYDYASDEEAVERAVRFRYLDPFQGVIPPALLSSKDFISYVKVTAMIHPFHEKKERIKAASYEIRAGKKAIWWDQNGLKKERVVDEKNPLFLQKNSITFVQIESTIRLPQYIALRFNLRISSVHRGLLLGTGPLIDPEFEGDILIPIHNLTDQDYAIPVNEGLIWVEFTKTSSPPDPTWLYRIEPRKSLLTPTQYLEKANGNNPIRSSLGGAIAEFRARAEAAETSARRARRDSRLAAFTGIVAFLGVAIGIGIALHSYFGTMIALAGTVQDKASTALAKTEVLASRAEEDRKSTDETKKLIDDSKKSLDTAIREIGILREEITSLRAVEQTRQQQASVKKATNARQIRRGRGRLR